MSLKRCLSSLVEVGLLATLVVRLVAIALRMVSLYRKSCRPLGSGVSILVLTNLRMRPTDAVEFLCRSSSKIFVG